MNGALIGALREAADLLEEYSKFGTALEIKLRNADFVAVKIQNEKLTAEVTRLQKIVDQLNRRLDAVHRRGQ